MAAPLFLKGEKTVRKLMWFAIGFAAACAIGVWFYAVFALWMAAVALTIGLVGLLISIWWKPARICAALLLGLGVGVLWFYQYDQTYLHAARQLDGRTVKSAFEVTDHGYETDYGTAVSVVTYIDGKPYQALVYLDGKEQLRPGDRLTGSFFFRFTAEGGSKEPTYHRSEGVFLLAYARSEVKIEHCEDVPPVYYPALWRNWLLKRIDTIFPADAAAFAKALLLGYRYDLDYQTSTAFRIAGISHIVAVSGLHVSILFAFVYLFSRRGKVLSFVIGVPVLILFAAMAGFTPSVTRACIMQALMLLALLTDREYDPPTALSFAALTMLMVNPMVILSISFQLSVGCMVGIFLFCKRIHDWFLAQPWIGSVKGKGILPRLKRWFVNSVSVSMSASVVTTPLVAYYFGTVSLVGVLANLLIVWLVSVVFYGVMLACAVSAVHLFAGKVTAYLIVLPIRFIVGTAKVLASFPLAAVYTTSIYIVIWLVSAYLLLALFLLVKKKPVLIYGCCVGICLCAALCASWLEPLTDQCRVTVLDVGQGQCILLQSEGRMFVVDCGGDSDAASADLAAETQLSQGIYHVDGIILTHYDRDHAGGVPYLLTRIQADQIFLPELADEAGNAAPIKKIAAKQTVMVKDDFSFHYGTTNVTIFGPELYEYANESGLCVLFQTENCDILITGDRGELGEILLLHRAVLPELEVLIAGHHGSAYSTADELLAVTKPDYVFISAGRDNIYGHPAPALLKRLREHGCNIYRTDENGSIIYRR